MKSNTHILKGKTYEFKEAVTRARAMKSQGLIKVKKVKVKGLHQATLGHKLMTVPLAAMLPSNIKETLEVRMRH